MAAHDHPRTRLSPETPTPRNLAAIDAANLGLDFINHCALPLATVIANLPGHSPELRRLCRILRRQARDYRARLRLIRP